MFTIALKIVGQNDYAIVFPPIQLTKQVSTSYQKSQIYFLD
jgi:hypothetical protein